MTLYDNIKQLLSSTSNETFLNLAENFLRFLNSIESELFHSKLNIFQALGMAGDISIYGKKRKVKILREKDGKIIKRTIDLSKSDILNSEFFYVKNNDIIYVESNLSKRSSSGYFGNLSSVTSLLSFFISIFLLTSNN